MTGWFVLDLPRKNLLPIKLHNLDHLERKEGGAVVPVVDEGDVLLNVYSVIAVASSKNAEMANNMVEFLTSAEVQELIGKYGVEEFGRQLFTPCAGQGM